MGLIVKPYQRNKKELHRVGGQYTYNCMTFISISCGFRKKKPGKCFKFAFEISIGHAFEFFVVFQNSLCFDWFELCYSSVRQDELLRRGETNRRNGGKVTAIKRTCSVKAVVSIKLRAFSLPPNKTSNKRQKSFVNLTIRYIGCKNVVLRFIDF